MTEQEVRELVAELRDCVTFLEKGGYSYSADRTNKAADTLEALAAPLDDAEIDAGAVYHDDHAELVECLENARQARLARIK